MLKIDKGVLKAMLIVLLCIVAAAVLHMVGLYNTPRLYAELGLPRTFIYFFLFIWWGFSVRRRIVQKQVRRYLTAIDVMMILWMLIRTVKYFFVSDIDVARQLWYFYYFPMLFIPPLTFIVALSLGKPEDYRIPKRTAIIFVITFIFVLFVLTNDFHTLVFTFPEKTRSADNNGYAFGYWIVICWDYLCAFSTMTIIFLKCRMPGSRRIIWLPLLPLIAIAVYEFIYLSGAEWLRTFLGDSTLIQCLLYIAVLESCIQCGLIMSNTGYNELFSASSLNAQIVDKENRVIYFAGNFNFSEYVNNLPNETLRPDRNTLIKSHPLRSGRVIWQEDITAVADIIEKTEENNRKLADRTAAEKKNYELKKKINILREKNRLYSLLQEYTSRRNIMLDTLLEEYETGKDEEERRFLLGKSAVIGAFVKRMGNLIFLQQQSDFVSLGELSHAIEESFLSLRLMKIECGLSAAENEMISASAAMNLYEFFEDAVEAALDDLHSLMVNIGSEKNKIYLRVSAESGRDLSFLAEKADKCSEDEGIWSLSVSAASEVK